MNETNGFDRGFFYHYACHEDELDLCRLELRTLFGHVPNEGRLLRSARNIAVSRSPFIKRQVAVMFEGELIADITEQVQQLQLNGASFKVIFVHSDQTVEYGKRLALEREIGSRIRGKAEMRRPDRVFGLVNSQGRWFFGECRENDAVWLKHSQKPQQYSTALSTRVARALANIAVPEPHGIRAVDPCCGIGTVLIEALSMGIDMIGYDMNPLAVRGARINLAHFGLPERVAIADIHQVTGSYDAAILDMPYNLCSKITEEQQLSMLRSARRLAKRAVIVTTEPAESAAKRAGFAITDSCAIHKGRFSRQIIVCE